MKLFLAHSTLESWTVEDKADLRDGQLVVTETGAKYPVTAAVHFHTLASGVDEQQLLSKVKSDEQLRALGAEHMSDSVLIGETAYQVTEGFITEVAQQRAVKKGASPEADMLAAFILDKLT